MMKKIILLFAAFGLSVASFAEGPTPAISDSVKTGVKTGIKIHDRRNSMMQVGVKLGVNNSSMSSYDKVDLGLKSAFGFEAGALISARFGKRTKASDPGTGAFGAQIELLYMQNSIKNDYADNIKLNYFAAPIMLKWYFLPNFNVEAGVSIAGLMSSSPDKIEANLNQPWPGYEKATIAIGDLKGFDVKPAVGLAYTLSTTGLGIGARYYFGTTELAKNFPCKVSTLEVGLTYSFNIFKF